MGLKAHIVALKLLLALVIAGAVLLQLIGLPWMSNVMADDNPEVAYLRWPLLALSILGLACVEVIALAMWRLLEAVHRAQIFDARSHAWVDTIVWALAAATGLSTIGFLYLLHAGQGPVSVPGLALVGTATSLGALLLMIVMRSLLLRATHLQREMDGVI